MGIDKGLDVRREVKKRKEKMTFHLSLALYLSLSHLQSVVLPVIIRRF